MKSLHGDTQDKPGTDAPHLWRRLKAILAPHGLSLRGGVALEPGESAPEGPCGAPARFAILVGQIGAAPWPYFQAWLSKQPKLPENPLDTWSREVISGAAEAVSARAVFPNDRPYLPFQQWAMRAEGIRPSPLGILIHPEFGLWHAFRGALLFDETLEFKSAATGAHPCDSCVEKPCLSTCPVNAFTVSGYDVASCAGYVSGGSGAQCRDRGCLARNACPVGSGYRYPARVQAFHMAAFLANHAEK